MARSTVTYIQEVPCRVPVEKAPRRTTSNRPFNPVTAALGQRVRAANEASRKGLPTNGLKRPSPSTLGKERAKIARLGKTRRHSLRLQRQGPVEGLPPTPTPHSPDHGPLGLINQRNMEFVVRAQVARHIIMCSLSFVIAFAPRSYLPTPGVLPLPMVRWSLYMQPR